MLINNTNTNITDILQGKDQINENLIWPLSLLASFGFLILSLTLTILVLKFIKSKNQLKYLIAALIPLAVGALLGNSIFHIIPEIYQDVYSDKSNKPVTIYISISIILGIVICYTIEKIFIWCGLGHSHTHNDESIVINLTISKI
jgi:hypothetical protein